MKTRCDKRDDFNIPNVVHWMLTGYTTRAGAAYPFGSPEFTTSFQMSFCCSISFLSAFFAQRFSVYPFLFGHYIVCLSVFDLQPMIIILVYLSFHCSSFCIHN